MFTGLIEEVGILTAPAPRVRIACSTILDDLCEGDSVSVSGVCLTALDIGPDGFSADLAPETLRRTSLGDRKSGDRVNLERSVRADGRLGGHIVQGHVDGTANVLRFEELGDGNWWLDISLGSDLDRYVVEKGSISIDGISLTVASFKNGVLGMTIIPHTYQNTALRERRTGDRVNVEVDILAKYLEKLLRHANKPNN